jgi:hypothetical protein
VIDLVSKGDAHARQLIRESTASLALQVDTAVRRLGLSQAPLALGGQLVRGELKRMFLAAIKSEITAVTHVPDPCRGAIALAQRLRRSGAPGREIRVTDHRSVGQGPRREAAAYSGE